jgi:hypothetical protein
MPWRKCFQIHEIRRIDGGRGFRTRKSVFRIGGNTFYDRKNKILMKIPESKRSEIGKIAEFRGIPNGFPNLASTDAGAAAASHLPVELLLPAVALYFILLYGIFLATMISLTLLPLLA